MKTTFASLALLCSCAAHAGTVWFQGPPNDNATDIVDHRLADDFILAQPATVTSVTFWYQAQFQSDLSTVAYAFYANAGGALGATLASGTATPVTSVDVNAFQATFTIPDLSLPAGIGWLELHAGSSLTDTSGFMVWWAAVNNNADSPALLNPAPTKPQTPVSPTDFQQYAFQLDAPASAPEPATAILLLPALAALWRVRRRLWYRS